MTYYAFARDFSSPTAQPTITTGHWTPGAPALQRVLRILRTPLGGCLLDPTLGVDWRRLDKAAPNAAVTCRAIVLAGLKRLVADGSITNVSVAVDQPNSTALYYTVTFTDPRLPTLQSSGRLAV